MLTPQQRGFAFEEISSQILHHFYGFSLFPSPRNLSGDGGVDLRGTWLNHPVAVQCKHLSKPIAVSMVREFESSINKSSVVGQVPLLGVFSTISPLSTPARKWFDESSSLLACVRIENQVPREFFFNRKAKVFFHTFQQASIVRQSIGEAGGGYQDVVILVSPRESKTMGQRVIVV